MKKSILFCLAFSMTVLAGYGQQQDEIPLAPKEYRRPEGYNPAQHRYKYSLQELKDRYSDAMMQEAEKVYNRVLDVNSKGN